MADIAELGYRVDSSQLAQATKALDANTKAAGRTSTATKKMESDFKRVGKLLVELGIAYKFGQLIGTFIRNTIEAEKAQAQLGAVLKSTNGISGQTIKTLNEHASALQRVSTFDDEAVNSAQAVLLTFTKISGDVFPKATQAVIDMATALDLDLKSASIQVGKALNDPILGVTALGRAGVQFSVDQKKMIEKLVETGKTAEAQTIILKELETQFGGSALAARNTLGGALTALKNNFGDLLEGDTGGDGIRGTVDAVNELADAISDPAIKRGIDTIATGVASITGELISGIAQFANWISKTKEAFSLANGMDAGDATTAGLNDRIGALAMERRDLQKWDTDILGFIPSEKNEKEKKDRIAALTKESLEIQREVTRRINAERFEDVVATSSSTYDPKTPTGGSAKKGSGGKSDKDKEADRMEESYKRMVAQLKEQAAMVGVVSEVEKLRYQLNNGEMSKLSQSQKDELLNLAQIAEFRKEDLENLEEAAKAEEKRLEAIDEATKAYEETNQSILDQITLLGLSADEQEIWNNLAWAGVTAESARGQEITKNTRLLQETRQAMDEQIEIMDTVRDAGKGLIVDLGNGVKPIDAIADAWERVRQKLLEMAAEKFMDQIFGKQGDPAGGWSGGGGDSGGGWGDFFGAVLGAFAGGGNASGSGNGDSGSLMDLFGSSSSFGGGMANGGDIRGGKFYQVGERNRPELLNMAGRQYLIPGDQGNIEPIRGQRRERKSGNTIINIGVEGKVTRQTRGQIGGDVALSVRESTRNSA